MNLDNIKKITRINKKIVFHKLKNKLTNKLIDKLYRIRDRKISTYSFDYISFFRIDYSKAFDIKELLEVDCNKYDLDSFTKQCIEHRFKILSDSFVFINSDKSYRTLQDRFYPKLVPFSTKCYNVISDDYKLIDWQRDYNSDFNWKYDWYKDISYGNNSGNDIKVPWEIGRLQHLPMLALSFRESNSDIIIKEIKNQIFDFIASNPPNFGVQWMTSMDIGIRLVNLLFTLVNINNLNNYFNPTELELIDSYLYDHYLHIKENIEFSEGMRGNHYLSNLCSLIIYISFTEDNTGKKVLLNKYINLLEKELSFQFYSDGTNFEGSTRYHIFTSQMLVTVDLILRNFRLGNLSSNIMNNITSFTSELLEFDFPPQIGDNDSGFYWSIINSELLTFKSLKSIINKYYIVSCVHNYHDSGYIRKKYDNFDLFFKCGKLGQNRKGGHDHNDNLSYLLYYNMEPFVVDIGSYCYTSNFKERNKFRSTLSHNTLWIDGIEQNEFSEKINEDMFWMDTDKSNPRIIINEKREVKGEIEYGGKQYTRHIIYDSTEILITDIYDNKLEKKINIYLAPNIKVEAVENNVYKLWNDNNCIYLDAMDTIVNIEDNDFSPQYGVKTKSKKIILSSRKDIITHKYRDTIES